MSTHNTTTTSLECSLCLLHKQVAATEGTGGLLELDVVAAFEATQRNRHTVFVDYRVAAGRDLSIPGQPPAGALTVKLDLPDAEIDRAVRPRAADIPRFEGYAGRRDDLTGATDAESARRGPGAYEVRRPHGRCTFVYLFVRISN